MEAFGFLLLLVIVSIVTGIIGGLLYLIYLPFKRRFIRTEKLSTKISRKINLAYIAVLGLFALYQTYDAIYPSDSFYKDEFTYYTEIEFPESGVIHKKEASYPDMHGDYWSAAIAEFSVEDYEKISWALSNSAKFDIDTTQQGIGITADFKALSKHIPKQDINIVYVKKRGEWFKIAFLKDRKTIIFERSSS